MMNEHVNEHVNEQENRKIKIIAALKENPTITGKRLALKVNISYATVRREIAALHADGSIVWGTQILT